MAEEIVWSHEAIEALIDSYRNAPCLWNNKVAAYKNKLQKLRALNDISANMAVLIPNISVSKVDNKLKILRGQYLRARSNVKKSMKSGSGSETIYKPKLWFYDKLNFLNEAIDKRRHHPIS